MTLRKRDQATSLAERVLSTSKLPNNLYAQAVILKAFIVIQEGHVDNARRLINSGMDVYGPLLEFAIALNTINQHEREKRAN